MNYFRNEDTYPVLDGYNNLGSWDTDSGINNNRIEGESVIHAPLDANASWFKKYWRPAISWQYILVCLFDFIIGPVITMIFFRETGQDYIQWVPLTLQTGGFYHIAMGAIIGVYSWSRGQEKIKYIEE